ncbi:MAG: HAD family hydrolase [archaeon]
MNEIKLVVFDIDGTLLASGKHSIEPSAVKAIQDLKAKGIHVLIATGRTIQFIKPHIFEVINSDYYVTINGQCLLDKDLNIIKRHDLDDSDVEHIYQLCLKTNLSMGVKCAKHFVILNRFDLFTSIYLQGEDNQGRLIDDTKDHSYIKTHDKAMGIFIIGEVDLIIDDIKKMTHLSYSRAFIYGLEVFDKKIHKIKGIEEALDLMHISWDNVMVIGDGDNDVSMLKKAKIGVCMGNGTEHAKAASDYITTRIDDDGIKNALRHFKLID